MGKTAAILLGAAAALSYGTGAYMDHLADGKRILQAVKSDWNGRREVIAYDSRKEGYYKAEEHMREVVPDTLRWVRYIHHKADSTISHDLTPGEVKAVEAYLRAFEGLSTTKVNREVRRRLENRRLGADLAYVVGTLAVGGGIVNALRDYYKRRPKGSRGGGGRPMKRHGRGRAGIRPKLFPDNRKPKKYSPQRK